MTNWFMQKEKVKQRLINEIMGELETLVDYDNKKIESANYWIDGTHNVFAIVNSNSKLDRWIEIHFELYDLKEELIGDLDVVDTETLSIKELEVAVKRIVDIYFND